MKLWKSRTSSGSMICTLSQSPSLLSGFTNYGIHVDGVYRANIGMLVYDTADGAEHMVHGFSEVFSAVSRDYYKPLSVSPFKLG